MVIQNFLLTAPCTSMLKEDTWGLQYFTDFCVCSHPADSDIMGILGLSKLIADIAPSAIKENEMKNFFGKWNTPKSH